MQTIKGLIALLLVAVAVFAVAAWNDIKSQGRYAAKMRKPPAVNVAANANTGEMAANAAGKVANAMTNVTNQTRRKIPRT